MQVLDLTELSDVCDYFVLATGTNNRQVDSIVDEIEEKVAEACGEHPFSIEGRERCEDLDARRGTHGSWSSFMQFFTPRHVRVLSPRKLLGATALPEAPPQPPLRTQIWAGASLEPPSHTFAGQCCTHLQPPGFLCSKGG
ncbi:MAG: RsfS/YbeB/iojap family protein [Collinsella sp.]